MGKRVYEIARELSLETKEVMKRLREAGVEVNNHFAVVEDPVYERVFGQNGRAATPAPPVDASGENGRPQAASGGDRRERYEQGAAAHRHRGTAQEATPGVRRSRGEARGEKRSQGRAGGDGQGPGRRGRGAAYPDH